MNETLSTIRERRTTRKFKSKQIKDTELQSIIEAGLYAPSANNKQSWNFTIIQDAALLKELNDASMETAKEIATKFPDGPLKKLSSNGKFNIFYKAPTVIIVSGQDDAIAPLADCSAAMQNMSIAAESLEIGSCWNGIIQVLFKSDSGQKYKNKLRIPEGNTVHFALLLGYKDIASTHATVRRENTVQYFR